jgi:tetratricopeptide (TPR) repeat protein
MKKLVVYFCIVALCAGCRENQQPKDVTSQSHQNQLELRMAGSVGSEDVTFLLSSEFRKISAEIDALDSASLKNVHSKYVSIDSTGTALSSRLFMESDPEKITGKLNECFFNQMNIDVQKQPESFENSLPDRIYESKKATVAGACLLMLLLGEEADIPLSLVAVNSHYFIRFDNGKIRRNIELLEGGSNYPDSWYLSNYAKDTLDTLRTLSAREASGVLYHIAALSLRGENQNAAITIFAKALEKYPAFTDAQNQIDLIIDNSKKNQKMLEQLIAIRIDNPSLGVLDRSLALLYFRTGDFKAAADYYERALSRQPDDITLIKGAGISYLNLHEYAAAKKYFTKASRAAPSDAQVIKWLAECPE